MEFGKISDLSQVHWDLPPDTADTLTYLRSLPKTETRFYIGTPTFGTKEWLGKIFPPKTKPTDYLSYYCQNFNTIEFNTTHYRIPSSEQTQRWLDQVSPSVDFRFCPKVFKGISHESQGLLDKRSLRDWLKFLEDLKEARGPCFMQLPPHFDYERKAQLFHFLQQWPAEFELSIELRHPSWYEGRRLLPALEKYLRAKNIGTVILDVAGRRDLLHTSVTAPFVQLRLIGNNLHPTDFSRSQSWAEKFSFWSQNGLQKVFFFAHEPDDINTPQFAQTVIHQLNEEAGAGLAPLQWLSFV